MNMQTVKNYIAFKAQTQMLKETIALYNQVLGSISKPISSDGSRGTSFSTSPNAFLLRVADELSALEKTCNAYDTLCNDVHRFVMWCPSPYKELWHRQYIEGETLTQREIIKIIDKSSWSADRKLRYLIDVYNKEMHDLIFHE